MVCPFCGNIKTSVSNSRLTRQNSQVWRRRYCERCGRTFTTRENVEMGFLEVTKSNGSKEPFIRTKLIYSVINACSHVPNRVDASLSLVETIERNILSSLQDDSDIIESSKISDITQDVLKRYNLLAHLKYVGHGNEAISDKRSIKSLIKDGN